MRRIFALLAVASLSGCITDGPNKTGSAWLDGQDLGPQGYQAVTLPVSFVHIDTIVEPGVPAYSGSGSLVIGGGDAFAVSTSLWFDVKDTTRWITNRPDAVANPGWRLVLSLDTSCASGKVHLSRWNTELDTGAFLLGLDGADFSDAPDYEATASCNDDSTGTSHTIDLPLGDSTTVVRKGTNFGIRLTASDFASRVVSAVRVVNGQGDTLAVGLFEGRGAWGVRATPRSAGSLTSMATAGTRLRLRFDEIALRRSLQNALGIDSVASDSFDNTFSLYSARATAPLVSVSASTSQRFRLASWVVLNRDTTDLPFSVGANASKAFASSRKVDGKTMQGELRVMGLKGGIARIALVTDGDSVPFYTTQTDTVSHFYLFPGQAVEAPMYADPGWTKFWFVNDGTKVRFIRTVLALGVAADDQVQSVEDGASVYREEAIATTGLSRVRFEARTAFSRMLNRKVQEVWTDLYMTSVATDATLDGNYRIDLRSNPIDSATFIVRRRNQGVVE